MRASRVSRTMMTCSRRWRASWLPRREWASRLQACGRPSRSNTPDCCQPVSSHEEEIEPEFVGPPLNELVPAAGPTNGLIFGTRLEREPSRRRAADCRSGLPALAVLNPQARAANECQLRA